MGLVFKNVEACVVSPFANSKSEIKSLFFYNTIYLRRFEAKLGKKTFPN